jgi:hypothetical protein
MNKHLRLSSESDEIIIILDDWHLYYTVRPLAKLNATVTSWIPAGAA